MGRAVPYVAQLELADCAAACLAMTLAYHGRYVPLEELRDATGTGRDGVGAPGIVAAARQYGLMARGVKAETGDLACLPPGSVLHWDFHHFVVFEKVTPKGVAVVDPALGRRVVPADAFGRSELDPEAIRELAEQMYRRLDMAVATVPELGRFADKVGDAYSDLAKLIEPVPAQRVHGDYHLGQVMRTQTGWVVLDFEGEPASPLAQRRARSSPLRDVAGMLRSFDYAARHQLVTHPDMSSLAPRAADWIRRNGDAFCAGYAAAGGLDPAQHSVLLRAMLLDKAVYEVIYEARNRPTWVPIPLESIAEL